MIHRHAPTKFEALVYVIPPHSFELTPLESTLLESKKPLEDKLIAAKTAFDTKLDGHATYYYKAQDSPIIKIGLDN